MRLISAILVWGVASFLFFRRTQGVGKTLFITFLAVFAILFYISPLIQVLSSIVLILVLVLSSILNRKPQKEYEPAVVRVEGGGIKRGLMPAEAAIIIGEPFNLIIVLILFGMLKKGLLKQVNAKPWILEIGDGFRTKEVSLDPKRRKEIRQQAALEANIILLIYEEHFLELFEQAEGKETTAVDFGIIVKPLVKYVSNRIAGYDFIQTRKYYHQVIQRAHLEARGAGGLLTEKEAVFDRNLEWIMLNENFETIIEEQAFVYTPVWMRELKNPSGQLGGEETFSAWCLRIIEQMRTAVSPEALNIKLEGESENVLASLMNEISRATFYG